MKDIVDDVDNWCGSGDQVAIATVAQVYGSAPRPLGGKMACTSSGGICGSVSGGCVEGAVYEAAQEVIQTGQPRLLEFGVTDDTAWEVGLTCGGTIHIWVEPLDHDTHRIIADHLRDREPVAQATVLAGAGLGAGLGDRLGDRLLVWPDGKVRGKLASADLTDQVTQYALNRFAARAPGRATFTVDGHTVPVLVEVFIPPLRLVVVGAVHIAIPVVAFAKTLGWHTIVVDARATFATPERFPHADELIVSWPARALSQIGVDAETHVVILTHDDKVDIPALEMALASPARYIGILGSPAHQAQRAQALAERGVPADQIARIHAPIGLRINAVGPDEIAVGIIAEVVAVRRGADLGEHRQNPVTDGDSA